MKFVYLPINLAPHFCVSYAIFRLYVIKLNIIIIVCTQAVQLEIQCLKLSLSIEIVFKVHIVVTVEAVIRILLQHSDANANFQFTY